MTGKTCDSTERVTMINQAGGYPKEFDCYVQVTIILIIRARQHKSLANSDLELNKYRIYRDVCN